jgi:hypothetical protein
VQLGDLASDADDAVGAERGHDLVGELVDAVAAFIEGDRVVKIAILFEKRGARGRFRGKESGEEEPVGGATY